jgi:hypothetical protein
MSKGRLVVSILVVMLGLAAAAPSSAHGSTAFGGPVNGVLDPATPTLQFNGIAAFAGAYEGTASGAAYRCTAAGPNAGILPFGGPFSGTYSCAALNAAGAAPSFVTGSFTGWTNLVTVAMAGDWLTHAFNCEGSVTVGGARSDGSVFFGITMACVVQ